MLSAQWLTVASIRAAAVLYVLTLVLLLSRSAARHHRAMRLMWTAGCLFFLAHVGLAFHSFYRWSHNVAHAETARQTAALFGINWGGGLYANYVFTAIWIGDVIWWWRGLDVYRNRPFWIAAVIHTFMAFMFFNATVIFQSGVTRLLGLMSTAVLVWLGLGSRWRRRS